MSFEIRPDLRSNYDNCHYRLTSSRSVQTKEIELNSIPETEVGKNPPNFQKRWTWNSNSKRMTKVATMYVNQAGAIKKFCIISRFGVQWSSEMTQNEIWTMIPRALLSNIHSQRPYATTQNVEPRWSLEGGNHLRQLRPYWVTILLH